MSHIMNIEELGTVLSNNKDLKEELKRSFFFQGTILIIT